MTKQIPWELLVLEAVQMGGVVVLIESIVNGCIRLEMPARFTAANLGKSIDRLRQ